MIYGLFGNDGRIETAVNDETVTVLPAGAIVLTAEKWDKRFDLQLEGEILIDAPMVVTPSIEALSETVRKALQAAIDTKARSLGFSGGNALMLYVGFENHYQPIAQVFATWEASVWVEADAYKADVLEGLKPMLTGPQAVELMPAYPD